LGQALLTTGRINYAPRHPKFGPGDLLEHVFCAKKEFNSCSVIQIKPPLTSIAKHPHAQSPSKENS
jgi:hypothetical protein